MHDRNKRPHKHPRNRSRRLQWGVALFVGLTMVGATTATYHAHHVGAKSTSHGHAQTTQPIHQDEDWMLQRRTVLIIGTDARPGQPVGNADVLMVCSLDKGNHRTELLSIPRDTKVSLADGSIHKINAIMQVGGPEAARQVVSEMLGVPIDDYVVVRFQGVVSFIDSLGGVTIDVDKRMYTRTGDRQYGVINLYPGVQRLNGQQALAYVRYRHDALGDIGRTQRQQAFVRAVESELARPKNLIRLPSIAVQAYDMIQTDLNIVDLARIAAWVQPLIDAPIVTGTLPGSFHDPNPNMPGDASYWIVNAKQAKYVTRRLFEDGVPVRNPVQDLSQTAHWQVPAPTAPKATNTLDTSSQKTGPARHSPEN